KTKSNVLHQQLASNPGVADISFSSGAPSYNTSFNGFTAPKFGITKDGICELKFVDENYFSMFGLKMLAGQKVIKKAPADTAFKIVANETLIHELGIMSPEQAIGEAIKFDETPAIIIGVV